METGVPGSNRDGIDPGTFWLFCGRFQPPNFAHVAVVQRLVSTRKTPVVIGVVNPDPIDPWISDDPNWIRFKPEDNLLNYWERYYSIQLALSDSSTNLLNHVIGIVPMPRPSINLIKARRFMPAGTPRLVLARSNDEVEDWKADRYQELGLIVERLSLDDVSTEVSLASGPMIRALIRLGDERWKSMVPEAVQEYLDHARYRERVDSTLSIDKASRTINLSFEGLKDIHGLKSVRELVSRLSGRLEEIEGVSDENISRLVQLGPDAMLADRVVNDLAIWRERQAIATMIRMEIEAMSATDSEDIVAVERVAVRIDRLGCDCFPDSWATVNETLGWQ